MHARFSKDSDVYLKFFPRGVSGLRRARGAEVLPLLNRIVQALEEHLPDKLAAWKELREKWRALYVSASEGKSTVRSSAGSRAGMVEELQVQLTRNLPQLAAHFIGQPEKAGEAFDIGLVTPQPRRERGAMEETPPVASPLREVKPSATNVPANGNGNGTGAQVELAV